MAFSKNLCPGDFCGGPMARLRAPNAGGPGSIPGLGTRSHAATKTQCSQVNKHFILKFFK